MREWFRNARLGLFIHYGIYAVKGVAESWSFYNKRISYDEYMEQLEGFSASRLDMKEWAKLAAEAGADYAVLTTKHHDGVALFDTAYSDLSVVKKTQVKRDLIKEYTEEFRKQGIKIGLYYSLIDWSHPEYASVYYGGEVPLHPENANPFCSPLDGKQDEEKWKRFMKFNRNQLAELLSNYGTVDLLWFDGDWERSADQWELPEFKEYLLSFQKDLIINSRLSGYGDYKTPEQGLPMRAPDGEWEFCMTINDSWGYQHKDNHYKSLFQVVKIFTDCISMGGKLLLDIGPREDGSIDERQIKILKGLGKFIKENSEAIYDTRAGIGLEHFEGGSTLTSDGKTLYLFLPYIPREGISIKGLFNRIKRASVLKTGKELSVDIFGGAPWLDIPGLTWIYMGEEESEEPMTVVKVELEEPIRLYKGEGKSISFNVTD